MALILGLGVIAYSNSFLCSFHFDDELFITANPVIRHLQFSDIWHFYHARFITLLSLALNYHFGGFNVLGYHVFNLAVHLICALLVWRLVLLTLSTPMMKAEPIAAHADLIALLTALIFVCHPMQVEAVTYIWQRSASMGTMFYLLSLWAYIQGRLKVQKGYYWLALTAAGFAMFSKESSITLPVMIYIYERIFLTSPSGVDRKYLKALLLTVLIVPVTAFFSKNQLFHGTQEKLIPTWNYFLTEIRLLPVYLKMELWPFFQNFDYDYPVSGSILEWPVLASAAFLGGLFWAAWRLFEEYRLVSFCILWFFLALLPESSFWSLNDVLVEHRLYLPSVGFSLFFVCGLYYIGGRNNLKAMTVLLLAVAAGCAFLTHQRNLVWKNELTLWGDVVKKSPHKSRAYANLGEAYLEAGDLSHADAYLTKSILLSPGHAHPHYDRGLVHEKLGDLPEAMKEYQKAIAIDPQYAKPYNNLGTLYYAQNNLNLALDNYNKAIALNPFLAQAYNNRANIYSRQGLFLQAIAGYNTAIGLDPTLTGAYNNEIYNYLQLKDYRKAWAEAAEARRAGVVIDPKLIAVLKARCPTESSC